MLTKVLLQFSFRKHVVLEWKLPLTRMIVLLPRIAVMAGRIWEACQLLRYFVNLPVSTTFYSFLLYIAALEQTFSANLDCARYCIWGVWLEHYLRSSCLWVKLIRFEVVGKRPTTYFIQICWTDWKELKNCIPSNLNLSKRNGANHLIFSICGISGFPI